MQLGWIYNSHKKPQTNNMRESTFNLTIAEQWQRVFQRQKFRNNTLLTYIYM